MRIKMTRPLSGTKEKNGKDKASAKQKKRQVGVSKCLEQQQKNRASRKLKQKNKIK